MNKRLRDPIIPLPPPTLVSSIFAVQVRQTFDTHFSSYMMRGIDSKSSLSPTCKSTFLHKDS